MLRIPNLAIHLQTAKEREAFEINKEDHLVPIIATAITRSLGGGGGGGEDAPTDDENGDDEWRKRQEPLLMRLLASELNVHTDEVIDFELNLYDVQRASLGGAHSEFVHSSRLDNLASCYLSLRGLLDHVRCGGVEDDADIYMIAMFDHEEGEIVIMRETTNPVVLGSVRSDCKVSLLLRRNMNINMFWKNARPRRHAGSHSREPVCRGSGKSDRRRGGEAHQSRPPFGRRRRRRRRESLPPRSNDPTELLPKRRHGPRRAPELRVQAREGPRTENERGDGDQA